MRAFKFIQFILALPFLIAYFILGYLLVLVVLIGGTILFGYKHGKAYAIQCYEFNVRLQD